ncbi:MAG: DUF3667 domain-containing protein [Bacteroidia bacterium]
MTITCKNCNHNYKGHFCNNCGQSAETHEINAHFLLHDIQHGILHFDKGIFYTLKQLFTRPGHTIREFIDGKRIRHFKPLTMILVLAAIYSFLFSFMGLSEKATFARETKSVVAIWVREHYSASQLLMLPLFSFASFLAFKKTAYNYFQHIILNSYIIAQGLIINIVLLPVLYFDQNSEKSNYLTIIKLLGLLTMIVWTYFQFFKGFSATYKITHSLLSIFISIIGIFLCAIIYATIRTYLI